MTDDMLKVIVKSVDILITVVLNIPKPAGGNRMLADQQELLREVFKKELKGK